MSFMNSNNGEVEIVDMNIDFGILITFPEVINSKIDTKKFLNASQATLGILDKFGKIFAPVKYDIQNNIEKIMNKYLVNVEKHSTLQDLILSEKTSGKKMIAADALLWLIRGLKMVQLFVEKIVESSKLGEFIEDLGASVKESYKKSLEPYHDWLTTQLFSLLIRMVPSRSQLILALADNLPNREDLILKAMENFSNGLKANLMTLQCFMHDNNLDVIS